MNYLNRLTVAKRRQAVVIAGVVAVIGIAALGWWLSRSPQGQAVRPLEVGIVTWPGMGPCFVAREKRFFGRLDVRCRIIDDTRAKRAAYIAGDLDVFITTVDTYAVEAVSGAVGKMIFLTDESYGGDAIVAIQAVRSIPDLKGKRVAYAESTPSHFMLLYLLEKHGLTSGDITPVVVDDPSAAGQAFIAGQVDAAVTWEPFVTQAMAGGKGKILSSSRQAEGLIVAVFVTHEATLRDRATDIKTFTTGWFRTIDYVKSNPDDSLAIMARGLNMPKQEITAQMQVLRFLDRPKNVAYFNLDGAGPSQVEQLFATAGRLWQREKIIKDVASPSDVVDRRLLMNLLGQ